MEIEAADKKGDNKSISRIMNNLAGKRRSCVKPVCNSAGVAYSSNTEALVDWHAMFDKRFAAPDCDAGLELPALPPDGRDEEFGYEEFEECVLSMKSGKAPGPDEIPVEFFRNSPAACRMLFRLCTRIWVAEEVPKDFVLGLMCMVHKKGVHDDMAHLPTKPRLQVRLHTGTETNATKHRTIPAGPAGRVPCHQRLQKRHHHHPRPSGKVRHRGPPGASRVH